MYICIHWDMLHSVSERILHISHVRTYILPEKSYERDLTAYGLAHILGEPMRGIGGDTVHQTRCTDFVYTMLHVQILSNHNKMASKEISRHVLYAHTWIVVNTLTFDNS